MLSGKTILLTGAAGAIGRATARCLAGYGAKLMLCDVKREPLEQLRDALRESGAVCESAVCDVTDFDAVRGVTDDALRCFGSVDVLVNNAGGSADLIHRITRFEDAELDTIRFVMELNVMGSMYCAKAVLPDMIRRRAGKIINFSSIAGVAGLQTRVDYSAAKGALISFTKALAMEVGKYNITVNCVSPGAISRYGEVTEHMTYLGENGHSGTPEDVAEMVAYLASEKADFITGANFLVDGGRTLGPRGKEY